MFSLNNSFTIYQIKKIQEQMCLKIWFCIYMNKKVQNCESSLKYPKKKKKYSTQVSKHMLTFISIIYLVAKYK